MTLPLCDSSYIIFTTIVASQLSIISLYRQLCSSISPLHPVLPALVEVYVNSILTPVGKLSIESTNQPISEDEIKMVFATSLSRKVIVKILFLFSIDLYYSFFFVLPINET